MTDRRNAFADRWDDLYNSLPAEKKRRIDKIGENGTDSYQLKVIKRKRIYPEIGDVFVCSPTESQYFYGIVVNNHVDSWGFKDLIVVFIFKDRADDIGKTAEFDPNFDNLLVPYPLSVNKMYWSKGFFFNVGKKEDLVKPDYGFYRYHEFSPKLTGFFDDYMNKLERTPKYFGYAGACTDIGVAYKIHQYLIANDMI